MEKYYLIIDESGAKGYSKNPEQHDGEFGVMAGFLMPGEYYELYKDRFEMFVGAHNYAGKRHITDIPVEVQQSSRERIFEVFRRGKIPWFYEAIFTQGLYESEFLEGRGGSHNGKESLHAKLFMGLMIKVFACLHKFRDDEIELIVISDRIDSGVVRIFEKEIAPYLALLHGQPIEGKFTVYDRETQQVKKYTTKSAMSPESKAQKYLSVHIQIICEDSAVTFAADTLANSAHYYIKKNYEEKRITQLNSKQAVSGHPLESLVMHAYDGNDDTIWWPSDVMYRRCKDQATA